MVKEATGIDGAMAEGTSRPHCCRLVQIGTYRVGMFPWFDARPLRPVRPYCAKHMDDSAERPYTEECQQT